MKEVERYMGLELGKQVAWEDINTDLVVSDTEATAEAKKNEEASSKKGCEGESRETQVGRHLRRAQDK